jgi:hypothetical protein
MLFALRKIMKLRLFLAAAFLVLVLPSYLISQQKEFTVGIGGGYSLSLDAACSPWEIDWAPGEIYFKEHMKLKHSFSFNVQYFFNKEIGLQLEFHHQKASYFSQLEWYGLYIESLYIDIDHIEEPYTKPWSISSLSVSLFIAKRRDFDQKVFPYAFVGAGLYVLEGDKEFVLDRFRLGPRKTGELLKLGGGFKYRLNRFLQLNFRFFGQSIWRKESRYRSTFWAGLPQFDYDLYFATGEIARVSTAWIKTFTFLGAELSLEFRFSRKKKRSSL